MTAHFVFSQSPQVQPADRFLTRACESRQAEAGRGEIHPPYSSSSASLAPVSGAFSRLAS